MHNLIVPPQIIGMLEIAGIKLNLFISDISIAHCEASRTINLIGKPRD